MFPYSTLIILAGLPGSGKSTLAREIAGVPHEKQGGGLALETSEDSEDVYRYLVGTDGVICSTDLYFHDENGDYRFDVEKIAENHGLNHRAVESLMEQDEALIIVDNTNTQHWEFAPYLHMAKRHGYKVLKLDMNHPTIPDAWARNIHGVPMEAIARMLARFEPGLPEDWDPNDIAYVDDALAARLLRKVSMALPPVGARTFKCVWCETRNVEVPCICKGCGEDVDDIGNCTINELAEKAERHNKVLTFGSEGGRLIFSIHPKDDNRKILLSDES